MLDIVKFNTYRKLKSWKRVDYDWAYKYQCVDLMRDYMKYAEYPITRVKWNAIDLWNKWLWDNYTRVINSISAVPPIGAIIFFKQWDYGHVAIAWRANLVWAEILEQNGWTWTGDWLWTNAIRLRKHYYRNCVGWFVKK